MINAKTSLQTAWDSQVKKDGMAGSEKPNGNPLKTINVSLAWNTPAVFVKYTQD